MCSVLQFYRAVWRRKPTRDEQAYLRMRIREIAETSCCGTDIGASTLLLRREGWIINHKPVYRLYCKEGLNLRSKYKRKRISAPRMPMSSMPLSINKCWTMDFVSNQLYNGKKFRALTLLDIYTRECLDIYADQKITGEKVTEVLDKLKETRGLPIGWTDFGVRIKHRFFSHNDWTTFRGTPHKRLHLYNMMVWQLGARQWLFQYSSLI